VPAAAIATSLRALIAGDKVTEYKDGLDLYDVTLQLPDKEKTAPGAARQPQGALGDRTTRRSRRRGEGDAQRGTEPDRAAGAAAPGDGVRRAQGIPLGEADEDGRTTPRRAWCRRA
jgi:hypothetical protein